MARGQLVRRPLRRLSDRARPLVREATRARRGPARFRGAGHPRYVFVVTYGRSGSTLVQGLLNALPGALIRGESNFYLLELFRAQERAISFRRQHIRHGVRNVRSAFYGLGEVRRSHFVRFTRRLMVKQLLGTAKPSSVTMLGFKEVLWHRIAPDETEPFFEFFERVFPDARYVLNRRDHGQVLGSGFWQSEEAETVMDAIRRGEEVQDYLRRTSPERVYDTEYESLTSDDPSVVDRQLRGLAEFAAGACDDQLLDAMRGTMATGHGPYPFGRSRGRAAQRARQPGSNASR